MGFLDSVKDRITDLRGGGKNNNRRDWNEHEGEYYNDQEYDDDGYGDGRYDDYDEGYGDNYRDAYHNSYEDRPVSMTRFGVDRADYYNDNHSPLVTQSDVRSQSLSFSAASSGMRERGAARNLGESYGSTRSSRFSSSLQSQRSDELAFKDGLARSGSTLVELHEQRMRMENVAQDIDPNGDTGTLNIPNSAYLGTGSASQRLRADGIDHSYAASGMEIGLQDRISAGQVHQRAGRRTERLTPESYSEAEMVSQELKQGKVVVLDLRTTRPELAKRILDFSFGVVCALNGQVERHVDRVYIFTTNGPLTEAEQKSINI